MPALTERQREYVAAYAEHGSYAKAASALGVNESSVRRSLKGAAAAGALPGLNATAAVGHGMYVDKASALVDADGNVKQAWIKTNKEADAVREAHAALEEMLSKWTPPAIISPDQCKDTVGNGFNRDLLSLYTITDFHLGMYAWAAETGDDWNRDIATNMFAQKIVEMADGAGWSDHCCLNIMGDFLHWDGLDAVTPTNRHVLDADTRFQRLAQLALDCLVAAIRHLLFRHRIVKVYICEGNHDLASSVWIRTALAAIFKANDRVHVDMSPMMYYAFLWGETFIGMHHGHKCKIEDLPSLFASEPRFRSTWGKATQSYLHTGHYHTQQVIEKGGAIVERHPTLAARDAYSASGGYVSRRTAHAIVYHKTKGEIRRVTVSSD